MLVFISSGTSEEQQGQEILVSFKKQDLSSKQQWHLWQVIFTLKSIFLWKTIEIHIFMDYTYNMQ